MRFLGEAFTLGECPALARVILVVVGEHPLSDGYENHPRVRMPAARPPRRGHNMLEDHFSLLVAAGLNDGPQRPPPDPYTEFVQNRATQDCRNRRWCGWGGLCSRRR